MEELIVNKLIVDIRPTEMKSARVNAPFDKALAELQRNGYELISLLQNAGLRIQQGKNHDVSTNGNRVREGIIYIPGEGRFITRHSAVLDNPRKATQAHRKGKDYFVSDDQVRKALEDSIQIPYDVNEIPTKGFGEDAIARFCFGKNVKDYGLLLEDAGISETPLWFYEEDYVQKQRKPSANQLWLDGFDSSWIRNGGYGLYGNRVLTCNHRSRGIKVMGAKDTAQETYTAEEITKTMKELNILKAREVLKRLRK